MNIIYTQGKPKFAAFSIMASRFSASPRAFVKGGTPVHLKTHTSPNHDLFFNCRTSSLAPAYNILILLAFFFYEFHPSKL